jgi:hypothetical protein
MNEEAIEQNEGNPPSAVDTASPPTKTNGQPTSSADTVTTPLRGTEDPSIIIPKISSTTTTGRSEVESSRDMAQQIAFMSEELLRASQEKVNLAQTNHDSVFPSFSSFSRIRFLSALLPGGATHSSPGPSH